MLAKTDEFYRTKPKLVSYSPRSEASICIIVRSSCVNFILGCSVKSAHRIMCTRYGIRKGKIRLLGSFAIARGGRLLHWICVLKPICLTRNIGFGVGSVLVIFNSSTARLNNKQIVFGMRINCYAYYNAKSVHDCFFYIIGLSLVRGKTSNYLHNDFQTTGIISYWLCIPREISAAKMWQ